MNTKKLNYVFLNSSKNTFNITKSILGIVLLSFLLLTSCKSDEPEDKEDKPDGIALNERFKDNRKEAVQEFVVNAENGGTITGLQGTKVHFLPNSIGLNGNPVTGDFTVELVEIYGKSAMVLQNMSSKGKKPNGDEEALNSAGEFFINAKQNGTQLEILNPVNIDSRGILPADWEPMNVFRAGDDLEDEDLWQEADENGDGENDQAEGREGEGTVNGQQTMVLFSNFSISSFGWSNLDRWYNFAGQLTDLFVDVPTGYDDTNCKVYLSYDGETGLANMDTYNSNTELFTEHYGRIPVGQEVHFIMLAEINGILQYAIQPATIVDGHTEIITSLQPITEADLTTLLEALP